MQLILVDRGREFCDVLRQQFRDHPEVEIICGRFEELPVFDCVITAGNSFGLMDAGMDLAVVRFFGSHVMERIQKLILDDYLGEQPVGTCIIVPTDQAAHPFVAHSPTMRVPMNIQGTDHVYLAMWAALTAIHRHNRSESEQIQSVACPGLGTGTGGMNLSEAALQLCLAYEHHQRVPQFINPSFAQQRHERIYYGGNWGFKHPRTATEVKVGDTPKKESREKCATDKHDFVFLDSFPNYEVFECRICKQRKFVDLKTGKETFE